MPLLRFLSIALSLPLLFHAGFADDLLPTLERTPDKAALQERIDESVMRLNRFQQGHIVIGQVVLEDGDNIESVMSQMRILKDGYFSAIVKDFTHPLAFRAHQYAPKNVELKELKENGDGIFDIGIIKMRRLVATDLVSVQGQLTLEGSNDPTQATINLTVGFGQVNSPTNGIEPRPKWADSITIPVDESGSFRADGFSPIRYQCQISAPGYVTKGFPIKMNSRDRNDQGAITLEKTRYIDLEFIVSNEGPFELAKAEKVTLSGGARWKATKEIYGWDLEFAQRDGKFYFNHNYGPCFLEDLGKAELKDFLETTDVQLQDFPRDLAVEDGHVYLVNQGHWKRNILLKATLKKPE